MSNAPLPPPSGVPATADRHLPPRPPQPAVPVPAALPAAFPTNAAAPPAPVAAGLTPAIADVLRSHKHRVDGWTPVKVAAFIAHLGDTGSVTQAAAYVRMTTASCYALRNRPGAEPFAEAWETAVSTRHEQLADLALDRVRNGVERRRWYRGVPVGIDRVFSDRLLIHLLNSTDPARRRAQQAAEPVAETVAEPGIEPTEPPPRLAGAATAELTDGTADEADSAAECPDTCSATCPADCSGNCLAYAALADELADDDWLPPEIVATMARMAAERAARKAEGEAEIAAIGAAIDAACGRPPGWPHHAEGWPDTEET